ncbi:migration and invasion enhancer 1 [Thrips palmi]|uniref:Migration and invasion enhancer 1 n=1 Tax=Thrips palmi TaxID=161013 RepID=A0A6P8Z9Y7_THRPL|nr:migration and invasion enhancer 1 [Thrips palmi]
MEREQSKVNVHVTYCTPCGGKAAFDEMAAAIQNTIPTATVTGAEDHRSGAFEVNINGQNVHSRLQTFRYPDVDRAVDVVKNVSLGESVPSSLDWRLTDCALS